MPQEGNGQPSGAGRGFVRFTRESGNRIAKAVRTVEGMTSPAVSPQGPHPEPSLVTFRMATFTGSWSKNSSRTVTITGSVTQTASAYNFFATLGSATGGPFKCAVIKGGTNWVVIAAECPA